MRQSHTSTATSTNSLRTRMASPAIAGGLAAGALGLLISLSVGPSTDGDLFEAAGHRLLSSEALSIFDDPKLQVGPLFVLLNGLVSELALALRLRPFLLLGFALPAIAVAAVGAIPVGEVRDRRAAALAVAVAGPASLAAIEVHYEELLFAAALLATAAAAWRGRTGLAAVLAVCATGCKLSGILGLVVLLLLPTWRQRCLAFAGALLGTAALYAPFFLFGTVRTFEYAWFVMPASPAAFFVGDAFSWQNRVVQTVVVLGVGSVVALRCRFPHAVWAVPLVVMCARIVTDPLALAYYWAAPLTVLYVGLWTAALSTAARLQITVTMMTLMCVLILVDGRVLTLLVAICALGSGVLAVTNRLDRLALPSLARDG